jgi:hypothetical protein
LIPARLVATTTTLMAGRNELPTTVAGPGNADEPNSPQATFTRNIVARAGAMTVSDN